MNVDLTSVATALLSLASAAVLAAIPVLVPAILKRLCVANDADLNAKMTSALDAAAGEAYNYALTHEGGLANVAVHNDALAAGTQYFVSKFADGMKIANVTPDSVTAMVKARLGVLLAGDPTVTAGKPGAAPVAVGPVPVAAAPAVALVAPVPLPVAVHAAPIPVAPVPVVAAVQVAPAQPAEVV